jgi:hypothetical protein
MTCGVLDIVGEALDLGAGPGSFPSPRLPVSPQHAPAGPTAW